MSARCSASRGSNGQGVGGPGGVERAVEHGGGRGGRRLLEDAEDVAEREPLVRPVAAAVPGVDDGAGAGERRLEVARAGLEPPDLGRAKASTQRLPAVRPRCRRRCAEESQALGGLGAFEGEPEGVGGLGRARWASRCARAAAWPRRRGRRRARSARRWSRPPSACRARGPAAPAIRWRGPTPTIRSIHASASSVSPGRTTALPSVRSASPLLSDPGARPPTACVADLDGRVEVAAHEVAVGHDGQHDRDTRVVGGAGQRRRVVAAHRELVADPAERVLAQAGDEAQRGVDVAGRHGPGVGGRRLSKSASIVPRPCGLVGPGQPIARTVRPAPTNQRRWRASTASAPPRPRAARARTRAGSRAAGSAARSRSTTCTIDLSTSADRRRRRRGPLGPDRLAGRTPPRPRRGRSCRRTPTAGRTALLGSAQAARRTSRGVAQRAVAGVGGARGRRRAAASASRAARRWSPGRASGSAPRPAPARAGGRRGAGRSRRRRRRSRR